MTLPEKSADGTRPEITDEQKTAMPAAREACDSLRPTRPELSEEQQATLKAQMEEFKRVPGTRCAAGVTMPERPAAGTPPQDGTGQRPARPQITEEQKAAMKAARTRAPTSHRTLGRRAGGPGGHGPGGPVPVVAARVARGHVRVATASTRSDALPSMRLVAR